MGAKTFKEAEDFIALEWIDEASWDLDPKGWSAQTSCGAHPHSRRSLEDGLGLERRPRHSRELRAPLEAVEGPGDHQVEVDRAGRWRLLLWGLLTDMADVIGEVAFGEVLKQERVFLHPLPHTQEGVGVGTGSPWGKSPQRGGVKERVDHLNFASLGVHDAVLGGTGHGGTESDTVFIHAESS